MAKKLIFFVLVVSMAAWAQHGHAGVGGPPSGMGGGHGMGGAHDAGINDSKRHDADAQSGPKSPDTLLQQNPKLSSKLETMLPKDMTAQQACSGFKNLGQCVAAIHVAHNLGISFEDLKGKTTGSGGVSLGRAIQELDPKVDAKAEAKKGKKQADEDLKS